VTIAEERYRATLTEYTQAMQNATTRATAHETYHNLVEVLRMAAEEARARETHRRLMTAATSSRSPPTGHTDQRSGAASKPSAALIALFDAQPRHSWLDCTDIYTVYVSFLSHVSTPPYYFFSLFTI
jgi:hypothetical protein